MTKNAGSEHRALAGWKVPRLDYPTFRLTLLAKVMDRLTIRSLARRGDMTYAQWRVLSRLGDATGGATVGQVAELAWVDGAEVSRAVSSLTTRGLVRRQVNEADKRTPLLTLTELGRETCERLLQDRIAFHEALISDLSEEECDEFDELLERVAARLMSMLEAT